MIISFHDLNLPEHRVVCGLFSVIAVLSTASDGKIGVDHGVLCLHGEPGPLLTEWHLDVKGVWVLWRGPEIKNGLLWHRVIDMILRPDNIGRARCLLHNGIQNDPMTSTLNIKA